MLQNRFYLGLALVVVLVGIALYVGSRGPDVPERTALVAGLEARLNDVTGVTARHADGTYRPSREAVDGAGRRARGSQAEDAPANRGRRAERHARKAGTQARGFRYAQQGP